MTGANTHQSAAMSHSADTMKSIEDIVASYAPKAVYKILDDSAVRFADKPAIDFEGGMSVDYKTLAGMVDRAACGLQGLGVKKGVKVGLFLPNTPFSVVAYYAILKAGGTVVNYNPLYAVPELEFQVNDSETDILITLNAEMLTEKAGALLGDTRLKTVVLCGPGDMPAGEGWQSWDSVLAGGGAWTEYAVDPLNDVAVLQYTGGTTGTPKAAMLTHANLYINAVQFEEVLEGVIVPGEEKMLGVLPLFHVFAMTVVMNCAVWAGMEILLFSKFDPKQLAPFLKDKTPTILPAVPAMFAALATHSATKDIDLSSVKFAVAGGAPIAPEVKKLFEANCKTRVVEAYGLTETSPLATANPPLGVVKSGSVGPVASNTRIDIISLEDGKTVLPTGEKGEVCISGPQVMKGYFNKPEATADVLRDGRLHTGDIGYLDEDGYLFLVDRLKDMILVSGYNVYPTQVEAVVHEHPAVEECIVAGVPDDKRGEAVYAWVKLRAGMDISESELKGFLRDKISATEMPRKIIFKDEPLPKTAVGKLSRKLLLEQEGY